jgi:hypothetical protein
VASGGGAVPSRAGGIRDDAVATDPEWLGKSDFKGQAGAGQEAVEQVGSVPDPLESVADACEEVVDAGDGEVAEAAFAVTRRPRSGWGPGRRRNSQITVSLSRAAINARIAALKWVFRLSHTGTIGRRAADARRRAD